MDPRSEKNMKGVHADLVRVVRIARTRIPFIVIEGLRTPARQKELFAKGATRTMRSRHIHGFAVDIAPYVGGSIRWDWPLFDHIEAAMKKAAKLENVPITWGGDWKSFKDGPHWELPHAKYPDPR
jgi:peptidoglycan L-alanyl-D-glutamate endopeptidase CwlK